jgi:hypothetical protein
MRSLLLAGIAALCIAGLSGCGSSTPPPPPAAGSKPGVDGPQDSGVKPVKGRVPKSPPQ